MLSKKNRGAITIFMSLILVGMIALEGMLVDGARMRVAEVQTVRAMETAAQSALASFNKALKNRYGLFAFENEAELQNVIKAYMEKNLLIPENGKKSLDLYNYSIDNLQVQTGDSLMTNAVLKGQILEYMKYRAPINLTESFFKTYEALEDTKYISEAMSLKEKLDKALNKLKDLYRQYLVYCEQFNNFDRNNGKDINQYKADANSLPNFNGTKMEKYLTLIYMSRIIYSYMETEEYKHNDKDSNANIDNFLSYVNAGIGNIFDEIVKYCKDRNKLAESIIKLVDTIFNQMQDALKAYEEYKNYLENINTGEIKTKEVRKFIQEAKSQLDNYEKLLDREVFDKNNVRLQSDIDRLNYVIDLVQRINSTKKIKHTMDFVPNVEFDELIVSIVPVKKEGISYLEQSKIYSEFMKKLKDFKTLNDLFTTLLDKEIKAVITAKDSKGEDLNRVIEGFELVKIEKREIKNDPEAKKNEKDLNDKSKDVIDQFNNEEQLYKYIDTKIYGENGKNLPSKQQYYDKTFTLKSAENLYGGDSNTSTAQSLGLMDGLFKSLGDGIVSIRDKVYVNEYVMNEFNDIVYSKIQLENKTPEGRIIERVPELPHKNLNDVYLNGEIEYVLGSSLKDQQNYFQMGAKIFGVRFFMNFAHVVSNKEKMDILLGIATLSAGWTGCPAIVYATQWSLAACWAIIESSEDVKIITSGYGVPIFKNADNWITKYGFAADSNMIRNYKNGQYSSNPSGGFSTLALGYTDYCRLFLLIQGVDITLNRTKDMIYVNMREKEKQPNFQLEKSNTTVKVNSDISIKYLFMTQAFMPKRLKDQRYSIRRELYQGY